MYEIMILKHLQSKNKRDQNNIVKFHEAFYHNSNLFLIMEKLGDSLLSKFIKSKKVIGNELLKNILKDLMIALKFIHSSGVIHSDLKPENIMLKVKEDGVKIIDFGCSLMIHEKDQH